MKSGTQGHKRGDGLTLEIVRFTNNGRFGDGRVIDQRTFHFHRADAVPRHIQHVINATQNPQVAVVVPLCAVARKIDVRTTRPLGEIGVDVALIVVPDCARYRGPRTHDGEQSATNRNLPGVVVQHRNVCAWKRDRCRTWFGSGGTRQRRDHDATGFGLPPRINYRAIVFADVFAIPHPRFGIDGLTNGAQQSQLRQIIRLHKIGAPFHERTNCCRRRVENRDAVSLADLPEAIFLGPIGRAFEHHTRRTVGEWSVHEIRMSRDPTNVGRTPEHIFLAQVKCVLHGGGSAGKVATGGVNNSLGFSGGTRRVQNKQRIFRVHAFRFAILGHLTLEPMPPHIASVHDFGKRIIASGSLTHHDQHMFDGWTFGERPVDVALERQHLSATISAVGGDQHFAAAIVDAIAQGLR